MVVAEMPAVQWTEDIKYNRGQLELDAKSFQAWLDEVLPMAAKLKPIPCGLSISEAAKHANYVLVVGDSYLYRRTLPRESLKPSPLYDSMPSHLVPRNEYRMCRNRLDMAKGTTLVGSVCFTDDVHIPIVAIGDGAFDVWMSLTPAEVISQRAGIKRARGRVLIGGLGMGWFALRAAQRDKVKSMVIVEKDPGIAKVFGDNLKEQVGDKPVEIIVGDIWEYIESSQEEWDSILLDIWKCRWESRGCRKVEDLKATRDNVWAW